MLPPRDRRTPPATRVSPMSRASGDGAGEPVELGDDQGVAGAHGRECLVETGPGAVGAGESLVEVDPVRGDAETGEDLALGGEVLQDG